MMYININNPNSYKMCRSKQYDCYVCMPHEGTLVGNKLVYPIVEHLFNGKCYMPADVVKMISSDNVEESKKLKKYFDKGIIQMVNNSLPFVTCGAYGELNAISLRDFIDNYVLVKKDKVCTFTHENLEALIDEMISEKEKPNSTHWVRARRVGGIRDWACFVPSSQSGHIATSEIYNANGDVKNSKGDFIIAGNNNGVPDLNDVKVISNQLFSLYYNNQGWSDCLNSLPCKDVRLIRSVLPNLADLSPYPDIVLNKVLVAFQVGSPYFRDTLEFINLTPRHDEEKRCRVVLDRNFKQIGSSNTPVYFEVTISRDKIGIDIRFKEGVSKTKKFRIYDYFNASEFVVKFVNSMMGRRY